MADERLRLVAEVADQFTGPLDKLQTALGRTARAGVQTGKDMKKDFDGFHGSLGKATGALQGMLSPLQSLGVAGLGAGLGLSGIATALRSFSSGTQQLSILSKETGLAVNELRAFGALGERFGVSADTMQGGVKRFSDEMSQLRRRFGEAYSGLQAMNLGELVEKLVAAPNMKAALDSAMESLSNIGDPVKRRKVAEMLFGADQIGAVAGQVTGKYREMMTEIQGSIGSMSKETEKAAADFEKNMSRMGNAAERLKLNVLGPLLKGLNTIVESGDKAGIRGNAEAMDKDLSERLTDATKRRNALNADPVKNADEIKSLEKEIRSLTDAIKRSKDGAGPSGVSAIPMSYSGGSGGSGAPRIYNASFGGGGGAGLGSPGLGGFGGPLPTMGGGYGGGSTGGGYTGNGGVPRGPSSSSGPGLPSLPSLPSGPLGNGSSVTANPGAYKDVLDHIARSEGTANREGGGYNTSLGYGRYLPGHQEQNLTSKTLNEISALGNQMRRQPGNPNSSALGRYQIVGSTMRNLMRKMGLKGDELFDEKMQDRMGAELARQRGANATGLGQEWASLRGQRLARAVNLMRQVDPSASTMPNDRIASADSPPGSLGLDGQEGVDLGNGTMRMPNGRIRSKTYGTGPGTAADTPGSSGRMGDRMMQRMYGDQAPVAKGGKGSLDITLHGFPAGTKPRASMDDLFKDVNVSKSRQMETTSI